MTLLDYINNFRISSFWREQPSSILDTIHSKKDFDANRDEILALPITAKDSQETPVHYISIQYGTSEDTRKWIKKGVDINKKYLPSEETALHFSARQNPEHLEVLIKAGAELDAKDNQGFTPLHRVINTHSKNPEYAKMLLENGANPNIQDQYGNTPLHVSCFSECSNIIWDDLIQFGANCAICNHLGSDFKRNALELRQIWKPKMPIKSVKFENPVVTQTEKFTVEKSMRPIRIKSGSEQALSVTPPIPSTVDPAPIFPNLLRGRALIVFGLTPFFAVAKMVKNLALMVYELAVCFFTLKLKSIPRVIANRVVRVLASPAYGLQMMGFALYTLFNKEVGVEALQQVERNWDEKGLLYFTGLKI